MKASTRKPAARKPARPPEPHVRVTLHKEYWRWLWKQYAKLDKFEIADTLRPALAEVMYAVGQQSHREGDIDVWGPATGWVVLTQWAAREICNVAPSLTKNLWATIGMKIVPQISAQDTGRGFASDEQC